MLMPKDVKELARKGQCAGTEEMESEGLGSWVSVASQSPLSLCVSAAADFPMPTSAVRMTEAAQGNGQQAAHSVSTCQDTCLGNHHCMTLKCCPHSILAISSGELRCHQQQPSGYCLCSSCRKLFFVLLSLHLNISTPRSLYLLCCLFIPSTKILFQMYKILMLNSIKK